MLTSRGSKSCCALQYLAHTENVLVFLFLCLRPGIYRVALATDKWKTTRQSQGDVLKHIFLQLYKGKKVQLLLSHVFLTFPTISTVIARALLEEAQPWHLAGTIWLLTAPNRSYIPIMLLFFHNSLSQKGPIFPSGDVSGCTLIKVQIPAGKLGIRAAWPWNKTLVIQ